VRTLYSCLVHFGFRLSDAFLELNKAVCLKMRLTQDFEHEKYVKIIPFSY